MVVPEYHHGIPPPVQCPDPQCAKCCYLNQGLFISFRRQTFCEATVLRICLGLKPSSQGLRAHMHALLTHLFLFPSLTFFCFLYRLSIKIKSILTPLRGSEGCKPRVINGRGLRLPEKKVHQISKIKAFLRHTRSEGGSTLLRAATDVRGCFPVPIFERRTAHRSDAQKGPTAII